ncbi:hypothetical protein [Pseudodesulfovibrio sp.]|uniref:hypothetical protein n=1 Tax=unclassified Pseudodesulfovibrio TaxID=2661612 RepID=UPI003B00A076
MTTSEHQFDSAKASRRFISNLIWVVVICVLFLGGEGVRYYYSRSQLDDIRTQTKKLYVSALGPDIGTEPFGRLQFEHGKLAATLRIGLDPLRVLAALSRPAGANLRVEGLSVTGMRAHVRGFFGPNTSRFDEYMRQLTDDDHFIFRLENREDVFGGIIFSLIVEPQ